MSKHIDSIEVEMLKKELDHLTAEREADKNVLSAAEQWWLHLMPLAWDDDRHLANPCVNATTNTEQVLAIAVARMVGKAK